MCPEKGPAKPVLLFPRLRPKDKLFLCILEASWDSGTSYGYSDGCLMYWFELLQPQPNSLTHDGRAIFPSVGGPRAAADRRALA